MEGKKHRVRLTKDQLETICEIVYQNEVDGLLKVWEFILGKPLCEVPEGEQVDVSSYQIPRSQAFRICEASESRINMLWLNSGPGSYEEEAAAVKVA